MSVSKRTFGRLAAGLAVLAGSLLPGVASAHPLGNFTVNHYSRIEPAGDRITVHYVLDMAEIPTFQDKPRIDPNPEAYADQRAEEIRQNLHLELNGQAAPLHLEQRTLTFPEGAGGLSTLRLEAVYAASVSADRQSTVDLVYRDDNDPTRIGWREIVARPGVAGTDVQHSSVPSADITDELRTYPQDLLASPLNVREARVSFVPGVAAASSTSMGTTGQGAAAGVAGLAGADTGFAGLPGVARPVVPSTGVALLDRANTAFADLANGGELTPAFVLFAVGVAIVLGAAHALQPGHGKTIVAAYLVGSRGTAKHALFLGGTVTATHTAGVYALGIVTLFLSQYIVPERLYPVLEAVSGLLVVGIGIWLFGQRLLTAIGIARPRAHSHSHAEEHSHAEQATAIQAQPQLALAGAHSHAVTLNTAPVQPASEIHSHADDQSHAGSHSLASGHSHASGHSLALGHEDGHSHGEQHSHPEGHSHAEGHSPGGSHSHAQEQTPAETHSHGFGKPHSHGVPASGERVSWRSLLALGVSGGLLPCPEALMVLLITIAAHRVLFGLLLIVSFSTGLAAVLVAFGLLLVYARGFFGRINLSSGLVPRLLPVASALVIVIAGGVITAQALPQVL